MAADMGPYSAIENTEFKDMVKVLEPCYKEPSHVHVSQSVVLPCINQHKLQLFRIINRSESYDGALLTFVLFIFPYWQYINIWVPELLQ